MRIAIINDMPMAVEGLRRVVEGTGIHQVAWTAYNGSDAVTSCLADVPDLILMDIIMPGMSGVDTTREIMRTAPCPILLVTSSVTSNTALVFEAMGYGALDAVNTPILTGDSANDSQAPLLRKITMLNVLTQSVSCAVPKKFNFTRSKITSATSGSLITIGSSSGGPQALATILKSIPSSFDSSIVIVQHVDEQFATSLAEWLSTLSNIPVRVALNGDRPEPGTVFLAGSADHLLMTAEGTFQYSAIPKDTPYRPSVDVFWQSLEQHWDGNITAVLLTGMGKDGAESMLSLRKHGARTITQNEQTCAVYGMPKAANDLGAAMDTFSIEDIATALLNNANKTG